MRNHTGKEDLYTFPRNESGTVDLELMGTSYCDGNYRIERDNIRTWVFEYVVRGLGTLRVNDRVCHPRQGQCYIVPAFSRHLYFSSADDPWEKIFFNVSGGLVASLMTHYGVTDVILAEAPELEEIFRRGYSQCLETPLHAHKIAALTIHEIIATIAAQRPATEEKETQRLHDYLSTHPNVTITIEEMAAIMSLSVSQTIRCFKKDWGTTPYQFHLHCRISAAHALLQSTSKTIREVSEELGFNDEYHFSSIFKKKTGLTPGQARKKTR